MYTAKQRCEISARHSQLSEKFADIANPFNNLYRVGVRSYLLCEHEKLIQPMEKPNLKILTNEGEGTVLPFLVLFQLVLFQEDLGCIVVDRFFWSDVQEVHSCVIHVGLVVPCLCRFISIIS